MAPEAFWQGGPLPELGFRVEEAGSEMSVLRALGPPPSWSRPDRFAEAFRALYEDAGELALAIAQGEQPFLSGTTLRKQLSRGSASAGGAERMGGLEAEDVEEDASLRTADAVAERSAHGTGREGQPPTTGPHPAATARTGRGGRLAEPLPTLARTSQSILAIALDSGYVRADDADQLPPDERKLIAPASRCSRRLGG